MKVYGYMRKRFPTSLSTQLKALQGYACEEIYVEEEDLRINHELNKILDEVLTYGDLLVVSDLRVLGKNVKQLAPLVESLEDKNIRFISIEDGIDTANQPMPFYQVVKLLSELSYSCHAYMTRKALTEAKEKGVKAGRPAISDHTIEKIYSLYHDKNYSFRQIASACSVSIGTVHKYLGNQALYPNAKLKKINSE